MCVEGINLVSLCKKINAQFAPTVHLNYDLKSAKDLHFRDKMHQNAQDFTIIQAIKLNGD